MKDYLQALARKGEVTVLEHAGGKTTVALVPFSGAGVVTLQAAASAEQLVKELAIMVRNYPDKEAAVEMNPSTRPMGRHTERHETL